MKTFGKFVAVPKTETIPGTPVGFDVAGNPILGPDQKVNILLFLDQNGRDWFEVARQFPHPFYIAIDQNNSIVSMVDDFQASQIAGFEIIGVDEDYGYTRGPGGTVYGKIWDGSAIVEPENEPDQIPDEISRRQFFQQLAVMETITNDDALAAMQGGIIPAPLQVIIDQLPTEYDRFNAQMFFVGAQNFNRLHWLTDAVRLAMQWTLEQRDDFWREASRL